MHISNSPLISESFGDSNFDASEMVQYTYVEIVSKYYGQLLADACEHNIVCVQSTELHEQLKRSASEYRHSAQNLHGR